MPRIEHSNWEEAVSPYVGQRERAVKTLVVMAGSRFEQRRLSARYPRWGSSSTLSRGCRHARRVNRAA
jgi:hypothetical protein